jgi:hypothetical protein
MRRFTTKEKSLLRELLKRDASISLIDFVEPVLSAGFFEVSGFQQKVAIHLVDQGQLQQVMKDLTQVRDLVKYLELSGLLSFWDTFPAEDNSMQCGTRAKEAQPYFLTDFGVASDLLMRANRTYVLSEDLKQHIRTGFRTRHEVRLDRNLKLFGIGFLLLIMMGVGNIFANYQMLVQGVEVDIEKLNQASSDIYSVQKVNQTILDTLSSQSIQMIDLARGISNNTQNISAMEQKIDNQSSGIVRQLRRNQQLINENRTVLQRTDSLLKSISTN